MKSNERYYLLNIGFLLDVLHASVRLTYKAFGTFILKSYRETINGSCNGFRFLNNQRQSIYSAKHSNDLPKRFKISFIMSCLTDKTEISKCMNYHFLLKLQHSQTKKCTQCEFKLKCYIELWAILRYTKLFTIRDFLFAQGNRNRRPHALLFRYRIWSIPCSTCTNL